jgi:hypothetical protein
VNPVWRYREYPVYGLCHEFGHTFIRFSYPNFNEAWATYVAIKLLPLLYEELGAQAWPKPYDYSKEGLIRFE